MSALNISGVAAANVKTTTTQYLAVGQLSTAAPLEFSLANTTTVQGFGINQTYCSAGTKAINVCVLGESYAICAQSVTVGPIVADASTGKIVNPTYSNTSTAATVTAERTIIGRALQAGSTNQAIRVFVNFTSLTDGEI